MSAPLLILAAGGTGGHMFPAQALAEAMLARGWRVRLSTDARGARYADGFPEAVERRVVRAGTFARGGTLARLGVPPQLMAGAAASVAAFRRDRPGCVVGFGGYPSIPALAAATLLRLPRMIHEANGVPGRVNRLFARRVDRVACGAWPTDLPEGARAEHTGNPIRGAVREQALAPYLPPGDGPVRLLVIGGSQGATILARAVPMALARLPHPLAARLEVWQQARDADAEAARAAYREAGIAAEVAPFFPDVAERLTAAQLVISRAGASSIADISAIGRPAILIPFAAAADDHQTANARGLTAAGGAITIAERDLTPEALAGQIARILETEGAAAAMAAASARAGRPDAAERLADLVETVARGD